MLGDKNATSLCSKNISTLTNKMIRITYFYKMFFQDSEPDSPPSPAERDNAFTSDSDSSSSDSVSSSSAASEKSLNLKLPNQDKSSDSKKVSERPVIEELN